MLMGGGSDDQVDDSTVLLVPSEAGDQNPQLSDGLHPHLETLLGPSKGDPTLAFSTAFFEKLIPGNSREVKEAREILLKILQASDAYHKLNTKEALAYLCGCVGLAFCSAQLYFVTTEEAPFVIRWSTILVNLFFGAYGIKETGDVFLDKVLLPNHLRFHAERSVGWLRFIADFIVAMVAASPLGLTALNYGGPFSAALTVLGNSFNFIAAQEIMLTPALESELAEKLATLMGMLRASCRQHPNAQEILILVRARRQLIRKTRADWLTRLSARHDDFLRAAYYGTAEFSPLAGDGGKFWELAARAAQLPDHTEVEIQARLGVIRVCIALFKRQLQRLSNNPAAQKAYAAGKTFLTMVIATLAVLEGLGYYVSSYDQTQEVDNPFLRAFLLAVSVGLGNFLQAVLCGYLAPKGLFGFFGDIKNFFAGTLPRWTANRFWLVIHVLSTTITLYAAWNSYGSAVGTLEAVSVGNGTLAEIMPSDSIQGQIALQNARWLTVIINAASALAVLRGLIVGGAVPYLSRRSGELALKIAVWLAGGRDHVRQITLQDRPTILRSSRGDLRGWLSNLFFKLAEQHYRSALIEGHYGKRLQAYHHKMQILTPETFLHLLRLAAAPQNGKLADHTPSLLATLGVSATEAQAFLGEITKMEGDIIQLVGDSVAEYQHLLALISFAHRGDAMSSDTDNSPLPDDVAGPAPGVGTDELFNTQSVRSGYIRNTLFGSKRHSALKQQHDNNDDDDDDLLDPNKDDDDPLLPIGDSTTSLPRRPK